MSPYIPINIPTITKHSLPSRSPPYTNMHFHTHTHTQKFRIKNLTSSCNTSTPPLPQTRIVPPHDPSKKDRKIPENTKQYIDTYLPSCTDTLHSQEKHDRYPQYLAILTVYYFSKCVKTLKNGVGTSAVSI